MLLKRLPGGELSERWELPGGKAEPGEDAVAALKREITEELSVEAEVGELADRGTFESRGRSFLLYTYCVVLDASQVRAFDRKARVYEHQAMRWVTRSEALLMRLVDSDREVIERIRSPCRAG